MSGARFETRRAALADVVAIPVTPFAEDGTVDRDAHRALLRRLLEGGIRTLTPNGNTGEFYALTPEERRLVTESTVEEAGDRAVVLVGVGHDVPTAVASARHARELGARMVMVHQPVHPYVSPAGWVDYHRAIAETVPELGVVPYIRNAPAPDSGPRKGSGTGPSRVLDLFFAAEEVSIGQRISRSEV